MKNKLKYSKLLVRNTILNTFATIIPNHNFQIKIMDILSINHYSPQKMRNKYDKMIDDAKVLLDAYEKMHKINLKKSIKGKICLEYGPGAGLEVAALLRSYGAKAVICCDVVPFYNPTISKEIRTKLNLGKIEKVKILKSAKNFNSKSANGIYYLYNKDANFNFENQIDFIYSKDVVEHIKNLKEFFGAMKKNMKKTATAFHLIDYRSHGIEYQTPFDHLLFNNLIYNIMGHNRGIPNRQLWSNVKKSIEENNLKIVKTKTKSKYTVNELKKYKKQKPKLKKFKDSDLEIKEMFFLLRQNI